MILPSRQDQAAIIIRDPPGDKDIDHKSQAYHQIKTGEEKKIDDPVAPAVMSLGLASLLVVPVDEEKEYSYSQYWDQKDPVSAFAGQNQ